MYAPCIEGSSSQLLVWLARPSRKRPVGVEGKGRLASQTSQLHAVTCAMLMFIMAPACKSKMAKWRAGVGLEVHAESASMSKLFSRDANLRAREFRSLTLLFPELPVSWAVAPKARGGEERGVERRGGRNMEVKGDIVRLEEGMRMEGVVCTHSLHADYAISAPL